MNTAFELFNTGTEALFSLNLSDGTVSQKDPSNPIVIELSSVRSEESKDQRFGLVKIVVANISESA